MDERDKASANELWWDFLSQEEKKDILDKASRLPLDEDRPILTDVINGYHLCWKGLRPKTRRAVVMCRFEKEEKKVV
jgi:hypothetical protein